MTILTDMQLVLLTTAASRSNGSLLPPPESIGTSAARIRKAVNTLIRRGLAQEVAIEESADSWRIEAGQPIGVIITDTGRAAITNDREAVPKRVEIATSTSNPFVTTPAFPTKTALVLDLLGREAGATLDDLVTATGWLPHTTRAALTGLRKKGHALVGTKEGKTTRYHIAVKAAA